MIAVVAFAVAAAVGTLARVEAGRRWNRHEGFPLGTLAVNTSGSLALGLIWDVSPPILTVVGVAGIGAFTTFSSFARDTIALAEQRQIRVALLYVVLSCGLGVAAAAVGVALA